MRSYEEHATSRARNLRRRQTLGEGLLWREIRNHRLGGLKFRRQAPVGPYIADFLCSDLKLIVEADGAHHSPEKDFARDKWLKVNGYRVLRFANTEIMHNMDGVLRMIAAAARADGS
ncbi:MAG TPA: DUF559 domain-containing protein [Azospirillaceae bacterium]|nr:DUF559 domain-containing protein [Azospirillaceae bacterium]